MWYRGIKFPLCLITGRMAGSQMLPNYWEDLKKGLNHNSVMYANEHLNSY